MWLEIEPIGPIILPLARSGLEVPNLTKRMRLGPLVLPGSLILVEPHLDR